MKKSIKNIFHSEPFTKKALNSSDLMDDCKINKNKSAFIIELNQSNILITITIPIDVYEIYCDIELENKKISGWDEFYGNTKSKDYNQKLNEINELINNDKTEILIKNETIFLNKNGKIEQWF
jgi:hypothetical protein